MAMDHIEMSDATFCVKELANKGSAHFLDFILNIGRLVKRTIVVPNTVDLFDAGEPISGTGKDVDFMSPALKCSRQFCYVRRHASNRLRMESLPQKHCNAHI